MNLKFTKNLKLTWIQTAIFKTALMALGILLGVYFNQFFLTVTNLLWAIATIGSLYILYVWAKQ